MKESEIILQQPLLWIVLWGFFLLAASLAYTQAYISVLLDWNPKRWRMFGHLCIVAFATLSTLTFLGIHPYEFYRAVVLVEFGLFLLVGVFGNKYFDYGKR